MAVPPAKPGPRILVSEATGPVEDSQGQGQDSRTGLDAAAARERAIGLARPGGGTILNAIGNTPLVMVDGIWAKLEHLNPSGSIKARIAKYMIERTEREGLLAPGDTIVEASSGNTGNAMSMVAAVKGYRMLVVMPDGVSGERLAISRAFGAQVMTLGDFHVNNALAKVAELGRKPGYFAPQQFDSEWNVEENRTWLGPEMLAQLPDGAAPRRRRRRGRHRRHDRRRWSVLPRAQPFLPGCRRRA
jgi:Pyridoxal-phosphate dependent enzyme